MMRNILMAMALTVIVASCATTTSDDSSCVRMLVGSYGPAENDGIRLYEFNQQTGEANLVCGLRGVVDPSFLTIAPDNKHFYAVSEEDDSTAALVAAEIIQEGDSTSMRIINSERTGGEAPCYVSFHQHMHRVFTANYNGSSVTVFDINPQTYAIQRRLFVDHFEMDGTGKVADRQEKSHIHCVEFTPDSCLMLVDDLGSDKVRMFDVYDPHEVDIDLEPGSGPRHITFAPDGKHAYLINELSGKVTVFNYEKGWLKLEQYVTCDSVGGHGSADIHVSPDGRFLYASNRLKADGISIFSIDQANGHLTKIGYQLTGIHPRNFALSPDGNYLLCACRDSNIIQIFKRDSETGLLQDIGKSIEMQKPVCIKFMK